MPQPRRDPDRTRTAILQATLRVVGERGLEAVRHRAVAEAAGVSLGSVSNHFPTRDELLREALRYAAASERQRLDQWALALQDSAFELDAWMSRILRRLAADVDESPWRWLASLELQLACARDSDLRPVMEELRDAYRRIFVLGFRAAGSEDPRRHADLVVGALTGAILKQLAYPDPAFGETLEATAHGLIAGLGVVRQPQT